MRYYYHYDYSVVLLHTYSSDELFWFVLGRPEDARTGYAGNRLADLLSLELFCLFLLFPSASPITSAQEEV